jgi:hypothetical protein
LFFLAPDDTLMAATVNSQGPRFEVNRSIALFAARLPPVPNLRSGGRYDVSADGQRFLLGSPVEQAASAPLKIVVNWTADLRAQ